MVGAQWSLTRPDGRYFLAALSPTGGGVAVYSGNTTASVELIKRTAGEPSARVTLRVHDVLPSGKVPKWAATETPLPAAEPKQWNAEADICWSGVSDFFACAPSSPAIL